MRTHLAAWHRVARRAGTVTVLAAAALVGSARSAGAVPIVVAEFRWDVIVNDSVPCGPPTDPACQLSQFTLTHLWDGPEPAPTLDDSVLTLDGAESIPWFPLDGPGAFDTISLPGAPPASASALVSFTFGSQLLTLFSGLTFDDLVPTTGDPLVLFSGSRLLEFDDGAPPDMTSVPEPSTFSLLALALIVAGRRRLRRRR